jgi:hypothetical protein
MRCKLLSVLACVAAICSSVKSFLAPSAASKFGKKSQLHNAARSATASGSSSTAGVNGFGADVAKDAAAPPAAAEVKVPEVN